MVQATSASTRTSDDDGEAEHVGHVRSAEAASRLPDEDHAVEVLCGGQERRRAM